MLFHFFADSVTAITEGLTTAVEVTTEAVKEGSTNIVEEVGGFWTDVWDWSKEFALTSGVRLLGAIVFFIVAFRIMKFINKKLTNSKGLSKMPLNIQAITKNTVKVGMWVIVLITLAAIVGIEMSSIVATITALGLVVGMALEGSLSNLAGGVMLLLFKPFSVGDFINFGDEEHEGIVTDVGIFYTTIKTTDARVVQVPNGVLCNKPITDYSTFETKKRKINIVVGFDEDIDRVKAILLDVCGQCKTVLQEPKKPKVVFRGITENGMEFGIRAWIKSLDFQKAKYEIYEKAVRAFKENGIKLPYNQLDVHIVENTDSQNDNDEENE